MIVIVTAGPNSEGIYIGTPKGNDMFYQDLSEPDKAKVDNFLSIFDGNCGIVQIQNAPGNGFSDISFGIPGANVIMQTKTYDYTELSTLEKNYVDDMLTLVSE